MLIYDDVISLIRGTGGISVMFEEMLKRLDDERVKYNLLSYSLKKNKNSTYLEKRFMERYRLCRFDFDVPLDKTIFHSTYYRLPSDKTIKTVTTVHDFTYERCIGGIRKTVHSLQKNHAIRGADKVICVSENTKKDLIEFLPNVEKDKISVVYNGVSQDFFSIGNVRSSQAVLFVGQRGRYKNFNALVDALSMLQDFTLECVGGGDFNSEEVSLLNKKMPGRYSHLGYVSNKELNQAYNRAFCLVYPSLYEGFGIPVIEAMKAGCPVIAYNGSSIPEVAGSAALLLERAEPDEVKSAISSLNDRKLRESLIKQGYDQAKHFSWDNTFHETLEVYKSLLDGKLEYQD